MEKYRKRKEAHTVIGGLATYSSLHEWKSDSEVYEECTNHDLPVMMLPYEVLALRIKYKDKVQLTEFVKLWNYAENCVRTSRQKSNYWGYVSISICKLLSISISAYDAEMKRYHKEIRLAVSEYRKIVQDSVDAIRKSVFEELNRYATIDALRDHAFSEIERRDNAVALDYLKHMDAFRRYEE